MPGASVFGKRGHAVVVVDRAVDAILGPEADVEVLVEVVRRRRHPAELPAHALPEALDLGQRRARDGDERDVAVRQVHGHAVGVVGHERAARAALLPAGAEHEVLHQQLAPALEQVGERAPALGRVEDVVLLDALPGQGAARAGDLVAQVHELLLARQQRLALGDPAVCGHDGMVRGGGGGRGGLGGGGVHDEAAPECDRSMFTNGRAWGGARRGPCRCSPPPA